jgi:polyhydroxyalkanoate synthesis regulator phasin
MVPGFAVALARRSAKIAPIPKITTRSGPAHARRQRCPGCCAPFMTFFVFAILVIPLAVFTVAAFFAVLLWWIECDAYMLDVAADLASGEGSDMCSYYEWWLYIVGNLVGVSVADVTVESNHAFSAILDLLISVWSLAVAGLVVGLLASLSWVTLIAEGADSSLTRGFQKAFGNEGVAAGGPAVTTGSLEWSHFLELCLKKEINLEVAHLRELYDHAHRDENGSVNADEVERLLTKLHSKVEAFKASTSGMQSLTARMDTLEAKIDTLEAKIDTLEAKIDMIIARIIHVIAKLDM